MVTKSDHSNPLAVTIPYQFTSADDYPTEVLANRFQAWRYIIKDLVSYLREYASVQEEIVRQQIRLQQAVGISAKSIAVTAGSQADAHGHSHGSAHRSGPTSSNKEVDISEINRYFLPIGNGSIQDLPTILTKYHQQNVATTNKTLKEITTVIVPKLEELRKDLLMKIKEIKNLQNDFKNNLSKEVNETKNLLNQYYQAVDISSKLEHGSVHHSGDAAESFKYDPYLVKIKLDRQLKKQLQEENYLHQAYENLQESGRKLESIIVIELQNYWGNFLNMLSAEHASFSNFLLPNLNNGFLAKESTFEWDSFIAKNLPSPSISVNAVGNSNSSIKNGTFIDLNFHSRKFSDLTINNYSSPLNMSVREGYLERKSKFLKSYSRGWYVLTCNFIHEFKTSDRKKDQTPVTSISLDNFQVNDHTKNNGKSDNSYKFILSSKPNGIIHRSQTWAFKTDSYENMIGWYNDINNLVSLPNAAARARFLSKRLNLNNTNPNLVRIQSKVSRASSIVTNGTHAKSLKTVESNKTRITGTTNTENNQLSSTFSNTSQVKSPKLNHLINSDGTILTPVDTNERQSHSQTPLTSTPYVQPQQQPHPSTQPGTEGFYQIQPILSQPQPVEAIPTHDSQNMGQSRSLQYQIPSTHIQQPTPQQPQQIQQSKGNGIIGLPPNFINFQQGYYMNANGQQVQQFYDPIQQQYYTITQQPNQGPQPQYFPASPQPQFPSSPQPQFASSPQANQGYFFIQPGQGQGQPVPAQQGQALKGDYAFGGQLPYPTENDLNGHGEPQHHQNGDETHQNGQHLDQDEKNGHISKPDVTTDTTDATLKDNKSEASIKEQPQAFEHQISQLSI